MCQLEEYHLSRGATKTPNSVGCKMVLWLEHQSNNHREGSHTRMIKSKVLMYSSLFGYTLYGEPWTTTGIWSYGVGKLYNLYKPICIALSGVIESWFICYDLSMFLSFFRSNKWVMFQKSIEQIRPKHVSCFSGLEYQYHNRPIRRCINSLITIILKFIIETICMTH